MKKIVIAVLIILFGLAASLLIYFKCIKTEKTKIEYTDAALDENIKINDSIDLEYGKIKYISDYLSIKDGTLKDKEIKYDDLGEVSIKFSYKNDLGTNYRFIKINIVDTTDPWVSVPSYKTILVNTDPEFINSFFCADNHDAFVERHLEGEYDLTTPGTYNVKYVATDISENKVEKDMTLNVVESIPPTNTPKQNNNINYLMYSDLYNEYKNDNTKIGIDISRWQGDVDFEKLKESNVEFIMIRLGGQDGIDGEYYIDSKFKQNIEGAIENGFDVGVYFYSYAYTEKEAKRQAKYVVDNLKGYKIKLPIVFDWECWNKFNEFKISLYELTKVQDAFLNYAESKGYKSARYGSKNYLLKGWQDTKHLTWLAHYIPETNYEGEYFMWQRCDTGKVDGINGAVDVDILYLDKYKY